MQITKAGANKIENLCTLGKNRLSHPLSLSLKFSWLALDLTL